MAGETPVPSGGRPAGELREIADALRSRVDLFGKTLAAVATLGTSAVGLSEIGDLFPYGDGDLGWVVGSCASLGVAALAAVLVAVRLMHVGSPVFMRAEVDEDDDLDPEERKAVRPVFQAAARRFGYTSLTGLQERERALRGAAARAVSEEEQARRTRLADEVKDEIEQALARAQVVVIRRRASNAVSDGLARGLYVAVIVGLIMFAVCTDIVSSDRRDKIADAKACGEARGAKATPAELSATGICKEDAAATATPTPAPPSAAAARAQVIAGLAETLEKCAGLVGKPGVAASGPLAESDCEPVREAMAAIKPR